MLSSLAGERDRHRQAVHSRPDDGRHRVVAEREPPVDCRAPDEGRHHAAAALHRQQGGARAAEHIRLSDSGRSAGASVR